LTPREASAAAALVEAVPPSLIGTGTAVIPATIPSAASTAGTVGVPPSAPFTISSTLFSQAARTGLPAFWSWKFSGENGIVSPIRCRSLPTYHIDKISLIARTAFLLKLRLIDRGATAHPIGQGTTGRSFG